MIVQKVQCDQCGILKDQANNWFTSYVASVKVGLNNLVLLHGVHTITDCKHLCGQGCCQKELQRWMDIPAGETANG